MTRMIDIATFKTVAVQSGLSLSDEQVQVIYEMYGYLAPMIERVCSDRPRDAEPALVFTPLMPS